MMHLEAVIRYLVTKHVPGKLLKAIIAQQLFVRCWAYKSNKQHSDYSKKLSIYTLLVPVVNFQLCNFFGYSNECFIRGIVYFIYKLI